MTTLTARGTDPSFLPGLSISETEDGYRLLLGGVNEIGEVLVADKELAELKCLAHVKKIFTQLP